MAIGFAGKLLFMEDELLAIACYGDMMSDVLLAGTATVPITPPIGVHIQGYWREDSCKEVLDPLQAKALVLNKGTMKAAIVGVDLIGLEYGSVLRIRQRIGELCDVPPKNVMIATSHTHAGPAVMYLGGGPMDEDYIRTMERQIAGVVVAASQQMRPVKIGYGEEAATFNVNRRIVTSTETRMLPNLDSPVDQRVRVIRVDGEKPEPVAVLFYYTCHATVLGGTNTRVSGDYPGAAQRIVEQTYGHSTTAIFLPGCFGDVRPHLTTPDERFRGGTDEELGQIGRTLAAEVVKVSEGIFLRFHPTDNHRKEKTGETRFASASSRFRLRYMDLPSDRKLKEVCRALGPRYEQWRHVLLSRKKRGYAPLEISSLQIDQILLISMPGEVMLEIGQQVEASLEGNVLVLGYTNGNAGYLCTERSYDEGGYEPTCFLRTYLQPAPFTRETEKILVRTGIRTGKKVGAKTTRRK